MIHCWWKFCHFLLLILFFSLSFQVFFFICTTKNDCSVRYIWVEVQQHKKKRNEKHLKDCLNQESSCSRKAWSCSIFDGLKFPSYKQGYQIYQHKNLFAKCNHLHRAIDQYSLHNKMLYHSALKIMQPQQDNK